MLLVAMQPSRSPKVRNPIIDRNRVNNQRIAVPVSRRISIERWIWIFRMGACVGRYNAIVQRVFVEDSDQPRCLNNLYGPRSVPTQQGGRSPELGARPVLS